MLFHFRQFARAGVYAVVFVLGCSTPSSAQNTSTTIPPVLDVHVHAMDDSFPGGPMCPNESKFPGLRPIHQGSHQRLEPGRVHTQTLPRRHGGIPQRRRRRDGAPQCNRRRVRQPEERAKVERRCPKPRHPRYVVQWGTAPGARVPLDELRKDFTKDGFKVMGEIGLQYEGLSPSDPPSINTSPSPKSSTSLSPSTWAPVALAAPT